MTAQTGVSVQLGDAEATTAFGRRLAAFLRAGDLVILTGDLGAGKTTLTQGIGDGLGVRGRVASPTFIIAREHQPIGDGPGLIHVDAYRLTSIAEVDALDLDSSLEEAVTVVEWGAGLVEGLAQDRLEIDLVRPRGGRAVDANEDQPRRVELRGIGDRWAGAALHELAERA
ncbi:tRNA (adenosine(37)-N6)-threonylcarbamoyltransferase complex ATPase subunit type 1 TsaE [Ruania halotolerans]|uniref:tRNA (adenosine(37)-N6)-threonylcarbamoyltransferase complex ATPase subunit type 1 TsaE n=1 Tax=Ruania halotolerans TaxID=2897773 RepID=UPI001E436139|nr:tRNA (adenosine(37)-N6)-threonylcarbamoyltransferase complex ATPase subunit type 1 TsaE [Ruania halotolerans]UFU05702.1 tRNA (adenosine(37)-N6)-threonylcarbamoyltransferase complex ATPase subunit type 1 TsaE [Ruania halotolerans]